MADKKWTTSTAMKEFIRRERDVLDKHRMVADQMMDELQLMNEVTQDQTGMMPQGEMPMLEQGMMNG